MSSGFEDFMDLVIALVGTDSRVGGKGRPPEWERHGKIMLALLSGAGCGGEEEESQIETGIGP